jgi:elongation factor G
MMLKYLENEDLPVRNQRGLRKATLAVKIVPVICGSSFRHKGEQPLLDAIVDYLPAPTDLSGVQGVNPDSGEEETRLPTDKEPFSALAFKIMEDPYVGKLTFFGSTRDA